MKKYKNIYLLVLVVVASLVLTGCTNATEETLSDVEQRVTIVDSGEDATLENTDSGDVVDSSDTTEDTDSTADTIVEETDSTSDMTDDETPVVEEPTSFTAGDTYDGATNEDNIRIIKYSYYVENGQFIYEWTFNSGNTDQMIASYEAGYDSDSNLVVKFPSLTTDHVAKDGESVELGATLPTLVYGRDGIESSYKFELSAEKEYQLVITDDVLTLKVTL